MDAFKFASNLTLAARFVYYAPTLFTKLGESYENSLILAGMVNIGQFIGVVRQFEKPNLFAYLRHHHRLLQ